jgi:uncharacterized protein YeaO (DUF488 family)
LKQKKELLGEIRNLEKKHGKVTLLFGSKDERRNQAAVLAEMVQGKK